MMGDLVVRLGLNSKGFTRGLDQSQNKLGSFTQSVTTGALKVASVIGAVWGTIKSFGLGLTLVSEAEQASVAFSTMLGSAEAAKAMLKDLKQFAASTPFQLGDLRQAAQQLLAFGFAGDEVMGHMKTLGDLAAGTQKPIGDFVDIFGKVKASGIASMGDINRLADRGVPIFSELAKVMGVASSEVRGLVSSGKVGLPEMQKALENVVGSGGLFENSMEKQSKTMSGLWSTLKDNVLFIIGDISEAFLDGFDLKGMINDGIEFVKSFASGLKTLMPFIRQIGRVLGVMLRASFERIGMIFGTFKDLFTLIETNTGLFTGMRDILMTMLVTMEFMYKNWIKLLGAANPGAGALREELYADFKQLMADRMAEFNEVLDTGLTGGRKKEGDVSEKAAEAKKAATEQQTPGAAMKGSSEAISSILRNITGAGGNIQQKMLNEAQKQTKKMDEQKKATNKVASMLHRKPAAIVEGASIP